MNEFGLRAQRYFQQNLPIRFQAISDPTDHFSQLGQTISDQVELLAEQLEGPDVPGEDYLAKVGRLRMARLQAEEAVMSELVFSAEPEPILNEEDEELTPLDLLQRKWAEQDRQDQEDELEQQNQEAERDWRQSQNQL